MTTYYAIKNTEAKGAYTNQSLHKEKLKQDHRYSQQTSADYDEATTWSGVQGNADVQQTASKEHPLKTVFERYAKKGYGLLLLHLTDGTVVSVSLKEHYYSNRNFKSDLHRVYTQTWDYEKRCYISALNTDFLRYNYLNKIKRLDKSSIEFYPDYLLIENCDNAIGPQPFGTHSDQEYRHQYKDIAVSIDTISKIIPYSCWDMDGKVITDQNVLGYISNVDHQ